MVLRPGYGGPTTQGSMKERTQSAFDQTPKQNGGYNGQRDWCGTKSNKWYLQRKSGTKALEVIAIGLGNRWTHWKTRRSWAGNSRIRRVTMCNHGTDLPSENIPRDLTNTATGRAYRTKHTTPPMESSQHSRHNLLNEKATFHHKEQRWTQAWWVRVQIQVQFKMLAAFPNSSS